MHMRIDEESYEGAVEYSCHSTQQYSTRTVFITHGSSNGPITVYQDDNITFLIAQIYII